MERQLLFLLDYDLRMDESELLAHFQPFLRRPVASTSTYQPRSERMEAKSSSLDAPAQYPVTPRRSLAKPSVDAGLLTPSPSPTRHSSHMSSSSNARRAAITSPQRVSPAGSSSSGGTMSDDLGSDSGEEEMDLDSAAYRRQTRASPPQSRSTAKYAGNQPTSSRRSSKPSPSYPVTPTDDADYRRVEPTLRSQRSGSFLRMTYEVGKGMLSGGLPSLGHRSSKLNLKEASMAVDDIRVV